MPDPITDQPIANPAATVQPVADAPATDAPTAIDATLATAATADTSAVKAAAEPQPEPMTGPETDIGETVIDPAVALPATDLADAIVARGKHLLAAIEAIPGEVSAELQAARQRIAEAIDVAIKHVIG